MLPVFPKKTLLLSLQEYHNRVPHSKNISITVFSADSDDLTQTCSCDLRRSLFGLPGARRTSLNDFWGPGKKLKNEILTKGVDVLNTWLRCVYGWDHVFGIPKQSPTSWRRLWPYQNISVIWLSLLLWLWNQAARDEQSFFYIKTIEVWKGAFFCKHR